MSATARLRVAIIGAGPAGVCMAMRLRAAGIDDFALFERAAEPGGTWRDNRYPGCACDVESHMYSYSFDPNPDWSRLFSPWHEIRAYVDACIDRHGLRPFIRTGTEIVEARWDAASACWRLRARDGAVVAADTVVSATGPLSRPRRPDIPGLDDFRGAVFHSAAWDEGFDPAGRRIAVIGTGASAIQIVPQLAPRAARLDLYQRTAPWVVPRFDRAHGAAERWAFRHVPGWRRAYRALLYARHELVGIGIIGQRHAAAALEALGRWHLRRQVADPALRERLTPRFRIGCKRILVSDDYYPALTRPNVEVVTDPIARITPTGVATADGREREVDALVLATGFAVTDYLAPMQVHGRHGQELGILWRDRVETYLGIDVPGFPNFHLLLGPNTGLGHHSVLFMVEAQVEYVLQALRRAECARGRALDVRPEVARAWTDAVQARFRGSSWLSGCSSWYLDRHGRNTTLWPRLATAYWWQARRFDPDRYEPLAAAPAPAT